MAIDASIPLRVQSMDLSQVGQNFINAKNAAEDRNFRKQQFERQSKSLDLEDEARREQIASARFQNLEAREQQRLKSTIIGGAQLKTFLDSGDIQGAENFLQRRRQNLTSRIAAGENIDTNETDEALQLLKEDPEALKDSLDTLVNVGQQLKILTKPEQDKFALKDTSQGIARINERTGEADFIRSGGQILKPIEKGTTVNVGVGEKEEQKELGKIRANRYKSYVEAGDAAQKSVDTLQTLEQAVSNPNTTQGAFATIRGESKKIADLFGFEVEGLADDAIIASVGNKLALQLRSPKGEDGGLTGSTSDRDLKFLIAGVPNRDKTQEQNLALIRLGIRDKQRTAQIAQLADEYLRENETMKGFEKVKNDWMEANPLYEEGSAEKEEIINLLKSKPQKKNLQDLSDEELLKQLGI